MRELITGRRWTLCIYRILVGAFLLSGGKIYGAVAGQAPAMPAIPGDAGGTASGEALEYHTPLAGEPLHTVIWGKRLDIPARDRGRVSAIVLGGEAFIPRQGATAGTPIGAIFLNRVWERSRTRDVISIFVNDLEYDRSFGNLELVARFDSNTPPSGQKEVVNNQEITSSDVKWGTVIASLGPGLRYMVAPFEVDNDLKVQLLGRTGYFYAKRTDNTAPNLVLPPDTMLYGVKLRGRYDGMRRNLLELPHTGLAAGFDLDYMHRARWADFGTLPDAEFTKANTQDYLQFGAYLIGVGAIPGLSEKNRILFSLHGGITPEKSADRYNAITIGGGPFPGETSDLTRPDYPGTMFNQVLVADYVLTALQYRRELAPFLYLHLRETFIWADRAAVTNTNRFLFKSSHGLASTIGVDTGFFWDSSLYFGYSYDSGFVRNGKPGSALILTWTKSL